MDVEKQQKIFAAKAKLKRFKEQRRKKEVSDKRVAGINVNGLPSGQVGQVTPVAPTTNEIVTDKGRRSLKFDDLLYPTRGQGGSALLDSDSANKAAFSGDSDRPAALAPEENSTVYSDLPAGGPTDDGDGPDSSVFSSGDDEASLSGTLLEMEARYLQQEKHHSQEKRNMEQKIQQLTSQVGTLLVSHASEDTRVTTEIGDSFMNEIGEQLEQARDDNNELHKLVKAFQLDMQRLTYENRMLSEQHSRQLDFVMDLESKLQLQQADAEQQAAVGQFTEVVKQTQPSPPINSIELETCRAELARAQKRIVSLEGALCDMEISCNEAKHERNKLADELSISRQGAESSLSELGRLKKLVADLQAQSEKSAAYSPDRKLTSKDVDYRVQELELENKRLTEELQAERSTCALLQQEVDSIPTFIEQLHRERKALLSQGSSQHASPREDDTSVRVPQSLSPNPAGESNFEKGKVPIKVVLDTPAENSSIRIAADHDTGLPVNTTLQEASLPLMFETESRLEPPVQTNDTIDALGHASDSLNKNIDRLTDFGPCRNCYGRVYVL